MIRTSYVNGTSQLFGSKMPRLVMVLMLCFLQPCMNKSVNKYLSLGRWGEWLSLAFLSFFRKGFIKHPVKKSPLWSNALQSFSNTKKASLATIVVCFEYISGKLPSPNAPRFMQEGFKYMVGCSGNVRLKLSGRKYKYLNRYFAYSKGIYNMTTVLL